MKKILFAVSVLLVTKLAFCDVYVCLDKSTNEPKGMVDVDEKSLGDWSRNFTMIKADESYRGKRGIEIKYENGKLRHATKEEIEASKPAIKTDKERMLETLGITENDLIKMKAILK